MPPADPTRHRDAGATNDWNTIGAQDDSAFGKVNWSAANMLQRCDPIMVWFDVALRQPTGSKLPAVLGKPELEFYPILLIETINDRAWDALFKLGIVPTHLRSWYVGCRFAACIVPASKVGEVVRLVAAQTGRLVARAELCEPRSIGKGIYEAWWKVVLTANNQKPGLFSANKARGREGQRGLPPALQARLEELARIEKRPQRARPLPRPINERGPVVCIVDDRFSFASPLLQIDKQPVVATLWHQGDSRRLKRRLDESPGNGYTLAFGPDQNFPRGGLNGRLLPILELTGKDLDEASAYERAAYPHIRPRWSHGSAVAHMIAGATTTQGSRLLKRRSLLLNQLPGESFEDTLGASLASHVLDALHDALDTVEIENRQAPAAVIANLSLGTHGGPHDGTSMFERALRELLDQNTGGPPTGQNTGRDRNGKTKDPSAALHVVLAAGNSHLLRAHCGDWLGPQRSTTLRWRVMPDNPADAMLQIWVDRPAALRITVKPPGGPALRDLPCDNARVWRSGSASDAAVHAALIFPGEVAQGTNGSMALLAIAPTRPIHPDGMLASDEDGRPVRRPGHGPHGVWEIELQNAGPDSLRFDAWIQRDNPAPGRSGAESGRMPRHGYFVDATPDGADTVTPGVTNPDPRFTLNGIGTLVYPNRLWVVGAMRQCDQGLSTYSPAGPNRLVGNRCEGPDIVAPADDSLALPGLLTRGMLGSSAVRVDGTSIAAAVVTRELYRHLSAGRSAETFAPLPVQTPTLRPMRAAGEPQRADPILRGEHHRMPASATHLSSKQCGDDGTCS